MGPAPEDFRAQARAAAKAALEQKRAAKVATEKKTWERTQAAKKLEKERKKRIVPTGGRQTLIGSWCIICFA